MNAASERATDHEPLAREYEGLDRSLSRARADIAEWLQHRGGNDDTVERAVLIASELATNALHATPGAPFTVLLASVSPDHVELTIGNPNVGASIPPRCDWTIDDVLAPQGRGLAIVAALSEDVEVRIANDRVLVTARIRTTPLR